MNQDIFLARFFELLTINLPALILLILCIAVTLTVAHRHPPAARWVLFALVWMFVTDMLAIVWHSWLVFVFLREGFRDQTPFLWVLSSMEGLGYVLFLVGVNRARTPHRPPQYYDDPPADDAPRRRSDSPADERTTND